MTRKRSPYKTNTKEIKAEAMRLMHLAWKQAYRNGCRD